MTRKRDRKPAGKPGDRRKPRGRDRLAKTSGEPLKTVRGHVLSADQERPSIPAEFAEIADPRKKLFLQAIAMTPRIGRACRAAGICTNTSLNWRNDVTDPTFQLAFMNAWKMGIEAVEAELFRRGHEGYTIPVYHQGQLVGTEQKFDTVASIFMLKGADPSKYRENQRHEHVGPNGGPVQTQSQVQVAAQVQLLTSSPDELAHRLARMQESMRLLSGATLPVVEASGTVPAPTTDAQRYAAELAARQKGTGGNGHGGTGGNGNGGGR